MRHRALVVTVSTRAADPSNQSYPDTSGPVAAQLLTAQGFDVGWTDGSRFARYLAEGGGSAVSTSAGVVLVADGSAVGDVLRAAIDDGFDLVLTCGGTGISPTDRTPEETSRVLDFEVPGVVQLLRARSWDAIPTAALSRGVCGVAGSTFVCNLPGSVGGVKDGVAVLADLLPHALAQIIGGDHPRGN